MSRIGRHVVVVALVVGLPLASLGAGSATTWGPTGADLARDRATDVNSRVSMAGGRVKISGAATTQLYPGGASPIALTFSNKSSHTLRLGKVKVKVKRVTAPNANAQHPCTKADFTVIQLKAKLRLPKGKRTLASLGVPVQSWPQLVMRNLPVNQDGCKGARLSLSFKAKPLR